MIQKIADDFYFIERGWLNGNHFVFNGKNKVLIDTGYKKDLQHTLDLIRQTGLEPQEVELIISTHSHCDHIGGNRFIQELSGCEIGMHPIDRYFIETRNDWYTWWRYYDQEADFFTVTRSFADGDLVRLDGLELVVLHTPGHGSGQISLYCPQHKFLLAADAVWDGDFGVLTTRIEGNISPFLHQQSLEKLAALEISVIYPGHGSPLHDPKGAIDRCRRRLESFLEKPERLGRDQLKKIILYTLLAKDGFPEEGFFGYLQGTHWYHEVVDLYFGGRYRAVYEDVLEELLRKNLVRREQGRLVAALKA
ncbi:MAG: MBL fold metallo-hydrolase [Bacillota bacterium]|nr:MBL fold metallo-hydrolase [Thermoanaerobacteraceae bacterium]